MNRMGCLAITCIALGTFTWEAAALGAGPPLQEDTAAITEPAKKTQEELSFAEIKKQADELQSNLRKQLPELTRALQEAESDEERTEALDQYQKVQSDYAANLIKLGTKAQKLLETNPTGDEAVSMLRWLAGISGQDPELARSVQQHILEHQLQNEEIASLLPQLAMAPQKNTIEFLETVAQSDALPVIRAHATLQHLELIRRYRDQAQSLLKDANVNLPENFREFFQIIAKSSIEDIEQSYRTLGEEFGEIEHKNRTIAKLVDQALEAIEIQKNLQIGKVAPDIEGKDLDGVVFKLSDYRGKVVMLDFWGDW